MLIYCIYLISALLEGQSPIPKKPDVSEQERLDAVKREQEEAAKMKMVG